MLETINSTTSARNGAEQRTVNGDVKASGDVKVNTDNLSPEAARRFERFAGLVDSFEKAASSGAISPPPSVSRDKS